ncbi:MAG: fumarylacetoacetate hydrolase family protein [Candidatus Protistobacter heckmanni]|nr:fumarylacetoacetate hydrolase family protein [Candidatus Protistobacter heckmanni]
MKLASLKDGSRDGQLAVVSRDLTQAVYATGVAPTLQAALDDWDFFASQLEDISLSLNNGAARHAFPFDPKACMAPLPRAHQWADGSAYVNHVELVRKARGADMPPEFWTDPLMYQGASDDLIGPCDDILALSEEWGVDFEAEVVVVTGDLPMGSSAEDAAQSIRLLMLVNDVSLRNLIPAELAKGFGFFQSKAATALSPVAVTPDELGANWRDCKVHLPMLVHWNGKLVGKPDCGTDMVFDFARLIAHIAKTRNIGAGSIVGSGTISNKDRAKGYACIAEQRALEMIDAGAAQTGFMKFGDTVRIEIKDGGASVFGAIDQKLAQKA